MRPNLRSVAGLKAAAVVVLVALVALCLVDVAQAAFAPATQTECAMCSEQSGCGAPATPLLALHAAILPTPSWAAAPTVLVVLAAATAPAPHPDRPVALLAPRSPPAA
jgi:hypothetical protein